VVLRMTNGDNSCVPHGPPRRPPLPDSTVPGRCAPPPDGRSPPEPPRATTPTTSVAVLVWFAPHLPRGWLDHPAPDGLYSYPTHGTVTFTATRRWTPHTATITPVPGHTCTRTPRTGRYLPPLHPRPSPTPTPPHPRLSGDGTHFVQAWGTKTTSGGGRPRTRTVNPRRCATGCAFAILQGPTFVAHLILTYVVCRPVVIFVNARYERTHFFPRRLVELL